MAVSEKAKLLEMRRFECNICLDTVQDPVVTQCGHLYCWPCLYRWLNTGRYQCPVCKAGVTRENVIPLYVRGFDSVDPRGENTVEDSIPNRPAAQRPAPPERPAQSTVGQLGEAGNGMGLGTGGVGFFPSLFGLQFQSFAPLEPAFRGGNLSPEEQQQAYLSRLLLMLGSFVILCLLFF